MVLRYILIFLGFNLFFILLIVFIRPIINRLRISKQSKRILLFLIILFMFPFAFLVKNYLYEPVITEYVTTTPDGLLVSTKDSVRMVVILDDDTVNQQVKYISLLENKRINKPITSLEDLNLSAKFIKEFPVDAKASESFQKIQKLDDNLPILELADYRYIKEKDVNDEEDKNEAIKKQLIKEQVQEQLDEEEGEISALDEEEERADSIAQAVAEQFVPEVLDSFQVVNLNIKGREFINQEIYPLLAYLIELQQLEQEEGEALIATLRIQEDRNPEQDLRLLPIATNPEDYQALIDLFKDFQKKNLLIDKLTTINVIDHLDSSFVLLPALILAYILNTLISYFLWNGVLLDEDGEPLVPKLIRQFASAFIYLLAITISIALVFPHVLSGFLTGIGTSGAIAALVAQQPIRQAFTALSLNLNKKIKRGDLIEIDGHLGVVEEIGWKSISFTTKYNNTMSVPNTTLVNSIYTNYTRPQDYRDIVIEVWTRIGVSPNRVANLLKQSALNSDLVLVTNGQAPKVSLMEIQSMRARYIIEVTTRDINTEKVQNEVLSAVWHMMARENLHPGNQKLKPEMKDPVQKANKLINNVPILEAFSDQEDSELAAGAEWVRYGWPEKVVTQGDDPSKAALYIVAEGELEVLIKNTDTTPEEEGENENGQKSPKSTMLRVATLGKNKIFGEGSVLTGAPVGATVRALNDVLILKISKETLLPIIYRERSILKELSQRLAERELENERKKAEFDSEQENQQKESSAKKFYALMNKFLYDDDQTPNTDESTETKEGGSQNAQSENA